MGVSPMGVNAICAVPKICWPTARFPVEKPDSGGNRSGNQCLATISFDHRRAASVRALVVANLGCELAVGTHRRVRTDGAYPAAYQRRVARSHREFTQFRCVKTLREGLRETLTGDGFAHWPGARRTCAKHCAKTCRPELGTSHPWVVSFGGNRRGNRPIWCPRRQPSARFAPASRRRVRTRCANLGCEFTAGRHQRDVYQSCVRSIGILPNLDLAIQFVEAAWLETLEHS